jgi:hypothetical protein
MKIIAHAKVLGWVVGLPEQRFHLARGRRTKSSTGIGWEMGNFGTVLRIVKELAKDWSIDFAGAVLRPHAGSLTEDNPKTKQVLEAARQAGPQLIAEGKISKDLLSAISQPLTSEPIFPRWHQNKP